MIRDGLWERPPGWRAPEPLQSRFRWVAEAFYTLSGKRPWISTGFGATPDSIPDERIDYHYERTLMMTDPEIRRRFHRWINAMDMVWREDWLAKAKARAEDEKRDGDLNRRRSTQ